MSNHKGRYAAPRKSNPFYLLAALATGLLLLVGACADTAGDPADFPVNAERRAGPGADPEPVVDEPELESGMSDEEIFILAMEMTFAEMTATELGDVCMAVDLFGMDGAVELVAEGWGAGWQSSYEPLIADMLRTRC